MIVISLTDCPPKVRGDLSKWLCEINTGVYVGNVSARVRDELWNRICENLKKGRATMVFSAAGEQHMDFRVHNTTWEPVDFDGLKLMRRPSPAHIARHKENDVTGLSKAAKWQRVRRIKQAQTAQSSELEEYTVIDLETTGLTAADDQIIELGALRIKNGRPQEEFTRLVRIDEPIPPSVTALTGITDEMLAVEGKTLKVSLDEFITFVGSSRVVSHNAAFDYGFLREACRRCNRKAFGNPCTDTLPLARRRVDEVEDYRLSTLAEYFSLDAGGAHRALKDCYLTYQLYEKLKEL